MTTPSPHLSRAAQVAAVHLGPINESRRRTGLAALTEAELTREFADLDRPPPRVYRPVPGAAASRSAPAARADTQPMLRRQTQAEIDAMHSANVAKLNREADLSDRRAR
jgi:hypothetical protein